jgi:hypothetical protein
MKTKSKNLSLHLARFRTISRKLNRLVASGRFEEMTKKAQHRLVARVRAMYEALRTVTGLRPLKRALAAAAIVAGLGATQTAEAQTVPNFLTPQVNPFGLVPDSSYNLPELADIDGDGDLDLLANTSYTVVSLFQNTGSATAPAFANPVPLGISNAPGYSFVSAGDLDNDGDLDLLLGESGYGHMYFYENIGTATIPTFASPVQDPFGLDSTMYIAIPSLADMDNDGDLDIWVGEYYGNVKFFQNVGTPTVPAFGSPLTNPFGITATTDFFIPEAVDLDGDGDIDLVVTDYSGDIKFFENIGTPSSPSFAAVAVNPFNLSSPGSYVGVLTSGDLDGDGDIDLINGYYYSSFYYYENTPFVSAEGPIAPTAAAEVFPNPVLNQLWVSWEPTAGSQSVQVGVINLQGQTLLTQTLGVWGGEVEGTVDVSQLAAGSYWIQLADTQGGKAVRQFVKQ